MNLVLEPKWRAEMIIICIGSLGPYLSSGPLDGRAFDEGDENLYCFKCPLLLFVQGFPASIASLENQPDPSQLLAAGSVLRRLSRQSRTGLWSLQSLMLNGAYSAPRIAE